MSREQQDPRRPKRTVKLNSPQEPPTRRYGAASRWERPTIGQPSTALSKSRYKIYNQPMRSTFAVTLDNIKRERESMLPTPIPGRIDRPRIAQRPVPTRVVEEQAGPSTKASILREESSTAIIHRKSHYFKDVFSEYLKKRQVAPISAPRRLRVLKFHVPRNLDEALEASILKFTPPKSIPNPWREPRLQWLEKLEQDTIEGPKTLPPDERDGSGIADCFMCLCPARNKRKSI